MWRDPAAVEDFCRRYELSGADMTGPLSAFRSVANAYALSQYWTVTYGDNPKPFPDIKEMRRQGIPVISFSYEVYEAHGAIIDADGPAKDLDDMWEWIAGAEARCLERAAEE